MKPIKYIFNKLSQQQQHTDCDLGAHKITIIPDFRSKLMLSQKYPRSFNTNSSFFIININSSRHFEMIYMLNNYKTHHNLFTHYYTKTK